MQIFLIKDENDNKLITSKLSQFTIEELDSFKEIKDITNNVMSDWYEL